MQSYKVQLSYSYLAVNCHFFLHLDILIFPIKLLFFNENFIRILKVILPGFINLDNTGQNLFLMLQQAFTTNILMKKLQRTTDSIKRHVHTIL